METVHDIQLRPEHHKKWGNFLISIVLSVVLAGGAIAYMVLYVPPVTWSIIAVFLLLGYDILMITALIFYLFSRPKSFDDTPKRLFRKQLKKALIFTVLVVALLYGYSVARTST